MGKQQTKKSKRAAELRSGNGGPSVRFVVRGKTFSMRGHATAADIAEHLRGMGYMRGVPVKLNGAEYTLGTDHMGDSALIRV